MMGLKNGPYDCFVISHVCNSHSYVIFNAKMTLFHLILPLLLPLAHNKDNTNNVIFALKIT